jgi:hypothetical protein
MSIINFVVRTQLYGLSVTSKECTAQNESILQVAKVYKIYFNKNLELETAWQLGSVLFLLTDWLNLKCFRSLQAKHNNIIIAVPKAQYTHAVQTET